MMSIFIQELIAMRKQDEFFVYMSAFVYLIVFRTELPATFFLMLSAHIRTYVLLWVYFLLCVFFLGLPLISVLMFCEQIHLCIELHLDDPRFNTLQPLILLLAPTNYILICYIEIVSPCSTLFKSVVWLIFVYIMTRI